MSNDSEARWRSFVGPGECDEVLLHAVVEGAFELAVDLRRLAGLVPDQPARANRLLEEMTAAGGYRSYRRR